MASSPEELAANFGAYQGPWLVGQMVQAVLTGVVFVQAWDYFTYYSEDSVLLKLLIAATTLLTAVSCACDIHVAYWQLVINYGDYAALMGAPVSNYIALFCSPVLAALSQSLFAIRTHKVVQSKLLAAFMAILIAASLAAGLALAVLGSTTASHIENVDKLSIVVPVSLWVAAGTDVVIAVPFSWNVTRLQKGFNESTDLLVSRLLRMALGTMFALAAMAVANAVAFKIDHENNSAYIAFNLTLPRVYSICMLYVLNARKALRTVHDDSGRSGGRVSKVTARARNAWGGHGNAQIAVHLETMVDADAGLAPSEKPRELRFGKSAHAY